MRSTNEKSTNVMDEHTIQTLKSTHKVQSLDREPSTIVSRREEDTVLRKWSLSRYCCERCILETKTKVGITAAKAPDPRTHPNIDEAPTWVAPGTGKTCLFIINRESES